MQDETDKSKSLKRIWTTLLETSPADVTRLVQSMAIPLHLQRTQAGVTVNVHPVVPLVVCDAYIRRTGHTRVLGTILGSVSENTYHVTSCFVVPHTETNSQVSIDTSHHQTLLELHLKVYPKDTVLGWFSSNHSLQEVDSLIQDYYANHVSNPIHLSVDASLESVEDIRVTAHVSRSLQLKGLHVATEFVEVNCRVKMDHVESLGLHLLQNKVVERIATGPQNLLDTLKRLTDLVGEAADYVSSVVDGSRKGDSAIGRYLADTLSVVPFSDKAAFEALFQDRLQELVLVLYLANLSKSQIAIADRLAAKSV